MNPELCLAQVLCQMLNMNISLISLNSSEVGTVIIIFILRMRKWRPKEVKLFAFGQTTGKWKNTDLNPGLPVSKAGTLDHVFLTLLCLSLRLGL